MSGDGGTARFRQMAPQMQSHIVKSIGLQWVWVARTCWKPLPAVISVNSIGLQFVQEHVTKKGGRHFWAIKCFDILHQVWVTSNLFPTVTLVLYCSLGSLFLDLLDFDLDPAPSYERTFTSFLPDRIGFKFTRLVLLN